MKFKEIEKKKLKRKYEFKIKATDLDQEVNEKLEQERPNVQMKGFRKGKVPTSLLKQMHGENILSEVMKNKTDEYVKNHLEASGDKPAYEPKIELVNKEWKRAPQFAFKSTWEMAKLAQNWGAAPRPSSHCLSCHVFFDKYLLRQLIHRFLVVSCQSIPLLTIDSPNDLPLLLWHHIFLLFQESIQKAKGKNILELKKNHTIIRI